jgi:hypothetical protein
MNFLHFAIVPSRRARPCWSGQPADAAAPDDHVRGLTFGGTARRLEPRSPALALGLSFSFCATVAGVWVYFR